VQFNMTSESQGHAVWWFDLSSQ